MLEQAFCALRRARRAAAIAVALIALIAIGAPATAQDNYPNRPVKIIAPQAPGGGVDLVARLVADKLRVAMGQASSSRTRRAPVARSPRR